MKNSLFTSEMLGINRGPGTSFSIIKLYESSNMVGKAQLCPRVVNLPSLNNEQTLPGLADTGIMKLYECSNMLGKSHMCPRVENIPADNVIEMIRKERTQKVLELSGAAA